MAVASGADSPAGNKAVSPSTVVLFTILLSLVLAHAVTFTPSEPFYNNDETRHVMTGVYVRDMGLLLPPPFELRDCTIRYYQQYPALGLHVWPPAFYGFEGLTFLIFGDSFLVARLLVGAFALLACVYLLLLVRRTHDQNTAAAATLVLGLSPLVFSLSDRAMLEVPALAWSLMAMFHFHRYLEKERKRDLALCCLATALTALTRYDGVFLAPFFFIWLLVTRKMTLLWRPSVLVGMGCAILAVAPAYYEAWKVIGSAHLHAIKEGTSPDSTAFLAPQNFVFYPMNIPRQVGWVTLLPLLIGFLSAWRSEKRPASWPYLALMLSVYITFTPMAELEDRHAIYWVPALAVFVVTGCRRIADSLAGGSRLTNLLLGVVLAGIGVQTWLLPRHYVYGYEDAARYVVEHNDATPVCLFDGFLNGDFIYQLRRLDPQRRLWVLRGDKLLYAMLSDPQAGYVEHARSTKDVLRLIHRFDPELIVVEEPQIHFDLPAARLLRQTLRENPDRFERVAAIPIRSNHPFFREHELHIFRNKVRNPKPADVREVTDLGFGRNLGEPMKEKDE